MVSIANALKKIVNTLAEIVPGQVVDDGKRIITHPYFPIVMLIALNIYLGGFIVADYGESWDEANNKTYADQSLEAYKWWGNKEIPLDDYLGPSNQKYRGPAYPMLASLFVSAMHALNSNWPSMDLWHFASFLFFQLSVFFFYMICHRYVNRWAAFGATLLFATQPLLWGHAFINSKDIPLMVFFLGSVALGLKMVDAFLADKAPTATTQAQGPAGRENLRTLAMQSWGSASKLHRNTFMFFAGLLVMIVLATKSIQSLILGLITSSYRASPSSFLGMIFSRLANNAESVPLEDYLRKGMLLYARVELFTIVVSLALVLLLAYFIFRSSLIEIGQRLLSNWSPALSKWLYLLAAAGILGLGVSTRVAGGLAGALIALYFLIRARKKAIPALIAYVLISMFASYMTWPFLWQKPIRNFIESLAVSSEFEWTGGVLFQGVEYPSYDLPATYFPVLLSLQFTEPIILLFGIGVVVAILKIRRSTNKRAEVLIILTWFFVPFLMVIILTPLMYDNFRHWLFIIPPIFLLSAFGLDVVFTRFRSQIVNLVILIALLAPGLYANINLHPYQYVYYNSFAGGVNGAFRQFELDYWVTAYREATLYLNEEAPFNSQVVVVGPRRIFMSYAREDLQREWFTINQLEETTDPVFVIISTRYDNDLIQFPDAPVVYRVVRDGAVLAVVKQIQ